MSIQEGLLDAIREEPDSDAHRLILADWLEDHDQPERAEFIRVQVALARLPEWHPDRPDLETRERALLLRHQRDWADVPDGVEVGFRRGFLERLALSALARVMVSIESLEDNATRFFAGGMVRSLDVWLETRSDAERLARLPELRSVRRLSLRGDELTDDALAALLDSPNLRQLTALGLRFNSIDHRALGRLGGALGRLCDVLVGAWDFGAADLAALLPRQPARLERLILMPSRLDADALALLAGCPHLGSLRHLRWHQTCGPLDAGVRALVGAPFAAGLESLCLGQFTTDGEALRLLLGGAFPSLSDLSIAYLPNARCEQRVSGTGSSLRNLSVFSVYPGHWPGSEVMDWLRSPVVAGMNSLVLGCKSDVAFGLPEYLVTTLANHPGLARVSRLGLRGTVGPESFALLLEGPNAVHWHTLDVVMGGLSGAVGSLVRGQPLPALMRLTLEHCDLTPADVAALATSDALPGLRELDLGGNHLDDTTAALLAQSPVVKRLALLDLGWNDIRSPEPFLAGLTGPGPLVNLADNPVADPDGLPPGRFDFVARPDAVPFLGLPYRWEEGEP